MPFNSAIRGGRSTWRITLLLLALVAAQGWSQSAPTNEAHFAVASVRLSPPDTQFTQFSPRGSLTFTATSRLIGLLMTAFGVQDSQISGLPKWSETTFYDVMAKPDKALSDEQFHEALQQLLKYRLRLAFHRETKMVEGYSLVLGKGNSKLKPSKGGFPGRTEIDRDGAYASNVTLDDFSSALSSFVVHYPVVNQTGIRGSFEINLKFATDENADSPLPSVFTAVQEQLGLKLERAKVPIGVIVIDHVDREPTEN